MPNTIVIRGNPLQNEAPANGVITPGELLQYTATGSVDQHAAAGGDGLTMVAIEESFTGGDIDTTYADGENVVFVVPARGDKLYMFLAAGESVTIGDPLESDGTGALQAHTAQAVDESGTATYTIHADGLKFYAAETLDNSGGGSRVRINVEAA